MNESMVSNSRKEDVLLQNYFYKSSKICNKDNLTFGAEDADGEILNPYVKLFIHSGHAGTFW